MSCTSPPGLLSQARGLESEIQFHGQLHDAGIAGGGYLAEGWRVHCGSHRVVVGVVECVEGLKAELAVQALCHFDVFVE